jgi:hypothetical protein
MKLKSNLFRLDLALAVIMRANIERLKRGELLELDHMGPDLPGH